MNRRTQNGLAPGRQKSSGRPQPSHRREAFSLFAPKSCRLCRDQSMGFAEHESEWHDEELIALIVADMQDPVTPILEAALAGKGLHDAGRMITRLREIVHHGAAVIDEDLLRVGTVEIDLGHVQPRSNWTGSQGSSVLPASSTTRYESQIR